MLLSKSSFAFFALFICSIPLLLVAQDTSRQVPHFEFGKVQSSDFTISSPVVDSTASVVILADVGRVELEYQRGYVGMRYYRFRRMMIRDKKGLNFGQLSLYFSADENGSKKLESLKAAVYNFDHGQVTRTDLADKDIFLDRTHGDQVEEKFAFPDIRVGSIIEYSFSIRSGRIDKLYPWDFQGSYPRLWTDFTVSIPDLYNYVFLVQGNHPLYFKSIDSTIRYFHYNEGGIDSKIHTVHWVMKDVPALSREPFTSTEDNYIAAIRFQLSQRPANLWSRERVLDTWDIANGRLLQHPYFGLPIAAPNRWLRGDLQRITEHCTDDYSKAKKIYEYVRSHYTVDGDGVFMDDPEIKSIFKKKRASVPEINLLLTVMLREAGIWADPIILSTRDNGLTNAEYPITENFNYVVVRTTVNSHVLYLDATYPNLGFGKLPLECYNGHARVITGKGFAIYLEADSVEESSTTTVFVTNDVRDSMYAAYTVTPGYYESMAMRDSSAGGGTAAVFRGINAQNPPGTMLINTGIDSLQAYEQPVTLHYEMKFSPGEGDVFYVNPMFSEAMKENPFKSANRLYPVELPYTINKMYILNMEVPNGYKIDELPKSVRLDLEGGNGRYEYSIQSSGNTIQLLSRLTIKKTLFPPAEYQALRDFYGYIVKKQSEQIVFKKIN